MKREGIDRVLIWKEHIEIGQGSEYTADQSSFARADFAPQNDRSDAGAKRKLGNRIQF
jgi:hypothetical protein